MSALRRRFSPSSSASSGLFYERDGVYSGSFRREVFVVDASLGVVTDGSAGVLYFALRVAMKVGRLGGGDQLTNLELRPSPLGNRQ